MTNEQLIELCNELIEHLEWIGWGDSWERECSVELKQRADQFAKEYS